LIQAAGHRAVRVGEGETGPADLVIVAADAEVIPEGVGGTVLRIRATPEPRGEDDDSIYRYDRAGLLTALSSHAGKRRA
jgi:two-component system chemotaxis sensor kinase CheA